MIKHVFTGTPNSELLSVVKDVANMHECFDSLWPTFILPKILGH